MNRAAQKVDILGYQDHLDDVSEFILDRLGVDEGIVAQVGCYLGESRGKRLRPLLCMLSSGLGPTDAVDKDLLKVAASVEMLHLGSLYHDDVIDRSDERRGSPSANAVFGNALTVLGGDILLAEAVMVAAEVESCFAEVVATALRELCVGQILETDHQYNIDRTIDQYLASTRGKTAALLEAACALGSLYSDSDRQGSSSLRSFAQSYGLAFQLRDDLLDLFSTAELLGKSPGTDVADGVMTYPMIVAAERSNEAKSLLQRWQRGDLQRICALVSSTGALTDSINLINSYIEQARSCLAGAEISPHASTYFDWSLDLLATFPGTQFGDNREN